MAVLVNAHLFVSIVVFYGYVLIENDDYVIIA